MRHLLLLLAAALALGACAPDDQVFDVSALSERHQRIFREAAADLNERYPRAMFSFASPAPSQAAHEPLAPSPDCQGKGCTLPTPTGWRIQFRPAWAHEATEAELFTLSAHELCHVLGFAHSEGNPQGEHCI